MLIESRLCDHDLLSLLMLGCRDPMQHLSQLSASISHRAGVLRQPSISNASGTGWTGAP